jgi:hypothetical protein
MRHFSLNWLCDSLRDLLIACINGRAKRDELSSQRRSQYFLPSEAQVSHEDISAASEESEPQSGFPTTQLMAVKVRSRSGCEERATDTERSASLPHAVGQVRCERALHTRRAVHGQYRSRRHRLLQGQHKSDCSQFSLKPKCTTATVRKITRDLNEDVRARVRALADTEAFHWSRRERKKVEMRFAH